MNKFFSILVGILLFLYGIIKITVTILAFSLSYETKAKIETVPVINFFINNDNTISGRLIDVILALFGVYTIIHSLQLFHILPKHSWLYYISSSEKVHFTINVILGFILFYFYFLVCYTPVPIPKTQADMFSYKLGGVAGGIGFFLSVPIMYIYFRYGDPHVKRSLHNLFKYYRIEIIASLIFATICVAGITAVIVNAYLVHESRPKSSVVSGLVFSQLSYLM